MKKETWIGELNDIIADYERVLIDAKPVTYTIEDAQQAFIDFIRTLLASQKEKMLGIVEKTIINRLREIPNIPLDQRQDSFSELVNLRLDIKKKGEEEI